MNNFSILLAGVINDKVAETGLLQFWNSMGSGTRDCLIIFGAALLVTLILILWALFIRTPKRQSKTFGGGHRRERGFLVTEEERERHRSRGWFGSRRRKRRRHSERPRNPTLAETGGLPPVRDENNPGNLLP
jgi:hypothetical protein